MSDKEQAMLKQIAALPDALQDKFVEHLNIATMVLNTMGAAQKKTEETQNERITGEG